MRHHTRLADLPPVEPVGFLRQSANFLFILLCHSFFYFKFWLADLNELEDQHLMNVKSKDALECTQTEQ